MIVRIVKLTIRAESISEFMNHFNCVSLQIRTYPGCSHLELLTDVNEPRHLFTYSIWDSEEALAAYTDSGLFKNTWSVVKPLFESRAEAWSLEKLQTVLPNSATQNP